MTRSVTTAVQTALDQSITEPTYLIQLELDTTLHLSTRGDVSWNSLTWTGGLCNFKAAAKWSTVSVDLFNNTFDRSQYMAGGWWRGNNCKVWLYVPSATDAIQLFDGILTTAKVDATITLSAQRSGDNSRTAPNIRIEPPLCNHLTAPGSTITWDNQVYEIQQG